MLLFRRPIDAPSDNTEFMLEIVEDGAVHSICVSGEIELESGGDGYAQQGCGATGGLGKCESECRGRGVWREGGCVWQLGYPPGSWWW